MTDPMDNPIIQQKVAQLREQRQREQRLQTAIHEAGHVLGARLAGSKVTSATIVPSRGYLGLVRSTTFGWEENIIECLLGYAAELQFGYKTPYRGRWGWAGHSEDYEKATKNLKEMLKTRKSDVWSKHTGIYGKLVVNGVERTHTPYHRWDINPRFRYVDGKPVDMVKDWQKALRLRKAELKQAFNLYRRKARRLAAKHADYIKQVADLLVEKQTLTDDDIPPL